MRAVKADLGKKSPQEVNAAVRAIIEENSDAKCLQVSVIADVAGDIFDVVHDWDTHYPSFTVLDVSVSSPAVENNISLDRLEVSETIFDEYFQKMGMADRTELKEKCKTLFRAHGA
jgi:hypothetical protein